MFASPDSTSKWSRAISCAAIMLSGLGCLRLQNSPRKPAPLTLSKKKKKSFPHYARPAPKTIENSIDTFQ